MIGADSLTRPPPPPPREGGLKGIFALVVLLVLCCAPLSASADGQTGRRAPPTSLTVATRDNYERTIGRASFCVVLYTVTKCDACDEVAQVAAEAARMIRERGVGALFVTMNVSDRGTLPADGVEASPAKLGLTSFPAVKVTHFGRVNHKLGRVPTSSAAELASYVDLMARPASVELKTADQVLRAIEGAKDRAALVVGLYTERDSQYRLEEMAENFRGMAQFCHVALDNVGDVLREIRGTPALLARYANATRGAPLPASAETFLVFKQQARAGQDLFAARMYKARDRLSGGSGSASKTGKKKKRTVKPGSFDPLRADGGGDIVAVEDLGEKDAAPKRPSLAAMRAGGATAWFFSPVVDAAVDAFGVAALPLHGAGFNRTVMVEFIARHVMPPVDVLTVHNREHFNIRTPYVLLFFTSAVSEANAADEAAHVPIHGIHEERSFLLVSSAELRYLAHRFETLSDDFDQYTFVFAALEDNRQIFSMFGFDHDAYDTGSRHLMAVLRGPHKHVFPVPPSTDPDDRLASHKKPFDVQRVRNWMTEVERGVAPSYVQSTPAPPHVPPPGSGDVAVVVHSTFDVYVSGPGPSAARDSIVFFSHETGLSERVLERFFELAAAERGNEQLFVAAFDALHNDPPEGFEYDALPAIFFVPRDLSRRSGAPGSPARAVLYDGDFTLASIASFAKQHATHTLQNDLDGTSGADEEAGTKTGNGGTVYMPKQHGEGQEQPGDSKQPQRVPDLPQGASGTNKFVRKPGPGMPTFVKQDEL